ncbi:MAG: type VI secretion system baseplate subunit TssE [Akkermansia sp.]
MTRLTDESPHIKKDPDYAQMFSLNHLKKDVMSNLVMLLNSHSKIPDSTFYPYPESRTSVLNFGLPSFTGRYDLNTNSEKIRQTIHEAIILYEPRFEPTSVQVSLLSKNKQIGLLNISIQALLRVDTITEDMFFNLNVDLDSGFFSLE